MVLQEQVRMSAGAWGQNPADFGGPHATTEAVIFLLARKGHQSAVLLFVLRGEL